MGLFGSRQKNDDAELIKRQREALARAQRNSSASPVEVAKMQIALAESVSYQYSDSALAETVSLIERALQVLPATRFPAEHAGAQRVLGIAYFMTGGKEGNKTYMEKSIPCLKAALVYYTRSRSVEAWGRLQMALGEAYFFQERSRCAKKYLTASLEVITPKRFPQMYQMVQERLEVVEMWILEEEEKKKAFRQLDPSLIDDLENYFKQRDEDC